MVPPHRRNDENFLATTANLIGCVLEFVDKENYLFFGVVSRAWLHAWHFRPRRTRPVTLDRSASQLLQLFECGLSRSVAVCSAMARLGNLQLLQWALLNRCPWNAWVTCEAAAGGHLNVLSWAVTNGCPWNSSVCAAAASGGHLEVLRWARDNGCAWDGLTCRRVAEEGEWIGVLLPGLSLSPWLQCRQETDLFSTILHVSCYSDSLLTFTVTAAFFTPCLLNAPLFDYGTRPTNKP